MRLRVTLHETSRLQTFGNDEHATPCAPIDSPDFWRAVVDSVPDLLMLVDRDGTLLYLNRAPTGTNLEECLGRNALEFVPAETRDELHASLQEIFLGAAPRMREQRGVHPDGTERWYATHTGGVRLKNETAAAVVVARDVTERRLIEGRASDWQKTDALGQLAAGIIHDFNNVLAIVGTAAQLIADRTRSDSVATADVETILSEARRGAALTRQLLAFARRQPLAIQEVDLNAVVGEVTTIVRQVLDEGIALFGHLAPASRLVRGNRSQLEQVVMNLVLNARDAIAGSGTIIVATVAERSGMRLIVSDTGCGIPDETRARIFDPFFTTKSGTGGTGLGLWTVRSIVRNLGGTIDVYSVPGEGTTVDILLPAAPAPGDKPAP